MLASLIIVFTALFVMTTSPANLIYQSTLRFIFVMLLLGAVGLFFSQEYCYELLQYVAIGGFIGILGNILVSNSRAANAFRKTSLFLMLNAEQYFNCLTKKVYNQSDIDCEVIQARLESDLLKLPDWIYLRGFDKNTLRGHEFFLQKSEELIDILFSMHHVLRYPIDNSLIEELRAELETCFAHANTLFQAIITVLNQKMYSKTIASFKEDFDQLQRHLQKLIPANLELITVRKDYCYLTQFIYELKELLNTLLKLAEALR